VKKKRGEAERMYPGGKNFGFQRWDDPEKIPRKKDHRRREKHGNSFGKGRAIGRTSFYVVLTN